MQVNLGTGHSWNLNVETSNDAGDFRKINFRII